MLMKDWEHGKEHTDTGQVSGVRRISVSCSIMSAVLMLLAREAIYRRVMKLAGESYSRDKFLEYDAVNRKSALKRMNAGSVDRNHFIPLASPVIID